MQSRSLVTAVLVGLAALVGGTAFAASAPLASEGAESAADTGTLALRAVFAMNGRRGDYCPAGTPSSVECYSREGKGLVPGLGTVAESYVYRVETAPSGCAAEEFQVLGYTARFSVAGKGEIDLAVDGSTECLTRNTVLNPTRPFTVKGGSGAYAGASGSGTLGHTAHFTDDGAAGTDTWIGTLVVPGLEFDVTPPTLSGAVGKTVRAPRGAKRVRVTYTVTARDDRDGAVPVSCQPRSGSRFRIGRTIVTCSATDTSGNTRTVKFRVTVKAAR